MAMMVGGMNGDEVLRQATPSVELYTNLSPDWIVLIQGAEQNEETRLPAVIHK